jgi:hypothetical protein
MALKTNLDAMEVQFKEKVGMSEREKMERSEGREALLRSLTSNLCSGLLVLGAKEFIGGV